MKKIYSFFLIFPIGLTVLFAQSGSLKPSVDKAIYFDISPPLRDMVQVKPGKYDNSWKEGVVKNVFDLNRDSLRHWSKTFTNPRLQADFGILQTDTIIEDFDGMGSGGGIVPPDTYGEAGSNFYFQVVNCMYAIFNKSGGMIFGPYTSNSVWNGIPYNANSGDAVVLYDEEANRWLFTQFSLPNYPAGPFYQMIAVSQTPDPTGSWYRWQYQFDHMPDYPKFGVWPDAYYMSSNLFGSGWIGNSASAYDRTAMLSGDPNAVRINFTVPPGSAGFTTLYPSDCDGTFPPAGTPNYFGYVKMNGTQYFGLYEFHANFSNPSASTFGNLTSLTINPFNTLQNGIPQQGTTTGLDNLGDRLMYRLQFRKFSDHWSMVINHSVDAGSGIAGVRWYELRKTTGTWSIYQQATFAPGDGNSRWMGSIAMDTAGSIALGYSVSGPEMYPAIRYTGRYKTDPVNQMTIAENTIINGGGSQTGIWGGRSRWGDYSGMSVDPSNPTTFWFTTEYYTATTNSSWSTRIGAFTFGGGFSTTNSATPGTLCVGSSSQLDVVAYGGVPPYTYSWTSIPPGFTSTLKNPVIYPTVTAKYIVATTSGTQTRHDTTQVIVIDPPTVFAGNDTTICSWANSFDVFGVRTNSNYGGWGTTGDGTFSNIYSMATTYYPGPVDKTSASVDLMLLAFAISPCQGSVISTKHILVDPCLGIPGPDRNDLNLTIGSNPAHGDVVLTITGLTNASGLLTITGIDGKTRYSGVITPSPDQITKQIDLSGFPDGVYLVRLKTDSQVIARKLVVQ